MLLKWGLTGFLGLLIVMQSTLGQAQSYMGYEMHGVSRGGRDNPTVHLNSRFIFGDLTDKKIDSAWQFGWEAGLNWLASNSDSHENMQGMGLDAFWVADRQLGKTQWHFFTKLGAEIEVLKYTYWYGSSTEETLLSPQVKAGMGYQFLNGLGLSIVENYRAPALNHSTFTSGGFYTSLMLTYTFK